jgi:hypothetical protein
MSKTGPCEWAEMMRDCVYVCMCMRVGSRLNCRSGWAEMMRDWYVCVCVCMHACVRAGS